jgi:FixJ family two-component response regulator
VAASSCLVVDHNLPGTNGLQTIVKLRERRISVPAILVTSHPSALLLKRATSRYSHRGEAVYRGWAY